MPKCPFLKAAAPRDFISSSISTFENTLLPLNSVGRVAVVAPRRLVTLVAGFAQTIQRLFVAPSQSVRSPPPDIHLLAA